MHTCRLAWSVTLLMMCISIFVTKEQTGLLNALHCQHLPTSANMREAPTPVECTPALLSCCRCLRAALWRGDS